MKQDFKKLYEIIGGEKNLQAILNRFYRKMAHDVLVGYFFTGRDIEHIALMQKAFILRSWGITQSYKGKPPAKAHLDLPPILKGHFDRRLILLKETLEEFLLPQDAIKTWINFESKFRKAVVSKEK